ncbi:anthranilate 1,2-dioxygenase small subunit [Rhodoferax sp. OV413]|uniref:anthranilate 1,2-dioxygenase small subunit AndAd n=1 Tax=Rhodoferax sp. OV413 TaxID=1855285 RepID=UPI00088E65E0|nr:anthranilate 1,2-dioxygenase small subunit AndAd [Rhodoferax sp. OV413]SDO14894.1 anthranilate 1,2-dioxygenase small subunit [Rhodoferax sp. OV413]
MMNNQERIQLWTELLELQHRYVNVLDNNRLEEWPGFFVEDCRYEIIPKENFDAGFPVPIIYCRNAGMLRDRVLSLRNANIYEDHVYRHATSGLVITSVADGVVSTESSYIVVITSQAGESSVYQAGKYLDEVVQLDGAWRYRSKRVVYDTLRVPTLLATPI